MWANILYLKKIECDYILKMVSIPKKQRKNVDNTTPEVTCLI